MNILKTIYRFLFLINRSLSFKEKQVQSPDCLNIDEIQYEEEMVRTIVQGVSRGDMQLQLGYYITEKDKNTLRKQVLDYKIRAPI